MERKRQIEEDLVDEVLDRSQDLVAILWDNGHARSCDSYEAFVSRAGTVYCVPCNSTVGSLDDGREALCPRCECARHIHSLNDGHCMECGNDCGLQI